MKKFTISMLSISVFFIGLGGLLNKVGATFKSDEKALALIAQARQAIGGEANIKNVLSLSATGKATKNFEIENVAKTEQGDWELNMQLPNKISKMMKVNILENGNGFKLENKENRVVIIKKGEGEGDKVTLNRSTEELPKDGVIIIKKGDGDKVFERTENPNADVKKVVIGDEFRASFDRIEQNDLFRTTLSLLLTTPQGVDAEYVYAGEGSVDGNSCDIVEARAGSSSVKLYLDKSSHLPRMMSYMDAKPVMFFKIKKDDANITESDDVKTFTRKTEAPAMEEFQVRFSDYRGVGGLQLPYLWTQTVGGRADESVEISNYEINPANIADKFENLPQKVMIRTEKKQ
ncbi:MAG: hypothetical protein WA584_07595 [Pyrinomonadaceae bacterium]